MIDFLCAHLPDTIGDMCIDFIEEHGDQIFDMLVAQMDPKDICTQLGLCHGKTAKSISAEMAVPEELQETTQVGLWSTCETCKVVVEYLDKILEDDTIEESLDNIIDKVCLVVPKNSRKEVSDSDIFSLTDIRNHFPHFLLVQNNCRYVRSLFDE